MDFIEQLPSAGYNGILFVIVRLKRFFLLRTQTAVIVRHASSSSSSRMCDIVSLPHTHGMVAVQVQGEPGKVMKPCLRLEVEEHQTTSDCALRL
jgi:hypothetical protein